MATRSFSAAGALALLRAPAVHTYAVVGLSALAQFATTVLLARVAGPAVVGDFALAITTANLLTGLALLGLDRIMVRELGGDLRHGDTARARQVVRQLALTVAIAAIVIALVYLAVVNSPIGERLGGDRAAMALAAGIVIVWPLLRLGRSVLRATGSAVLSQLTQEVPPILKFAAIGAMVLAGFAPTAGQLTGLSLLLYGGCALWVWWLSARFVRSWPRGGPAPDPRLRLAGLSMMSVLFLQTFTQWFVLAQLSATGTSDEVGVFRVAAQVAGIVATITQTTEFYVAPRMAGDFRAGRHDLAWRRQRRGTVAMLLLSAPVLLVAFLAPSAFLGLLFGPEFAAGATALSIVAFAQLVNALRGPIGAFLSMSGNDHWQLGLTIASVALAVGLGLWLIPALGVTGAAIAYASAFLLRSIGSAIVAWRLVPRHAAPPAEPPAPDEE